MKRRQLSELIFRMANGRWCLHCIDTAERHWDAWTPWRIVDGMRKWRWCRLCGRSEWA